MTLGSEHDSSLVAPLEKSAHLDNDHPKSKDIRLFARDTFSKQNFWGRPSCSVPLIRVDTRAIVAASDGCESKVTDACVPGTVYQDIWLGKGQYSSRIPPHSIGTTLTPFKSPCTIWQVWR